MRGQGQERFKERVTASVLTQPGCLQATQTTGTGHAGRAFWSQPRAAAAKGDRK